MKAILGAIMALLFVIGAANAASLVVDGHTVEMELPDGWIVGTDPVTTPLPEWFAQFQTGGHEFEGTMVEHIAVFENNPDSGYIDMAVIHLTASEKVNSDDYLLKEVVASTFGTGDDDYYTEIDGKRAYISTQELYGDHGDYIMSFSSVAIAQLVDSDTIVYTASCTEVDTRNRYSPDATYEDLMPTSAS